MLNALTLLHRWLGISLCLLFAMWFATGIAMHFVPFPELTEAERMDGLAPVDFGHVGHGPAAAVAAVAGSIKDATRVRLLQRSDGPVYLVSNASGVAAVQASDLSNAAVQSEQLALAIAVDHAQRRGMVTSRASFAELAPYDQWTVPNGFDAHRPLYRIALNDRAGTELYVSSLTGEVVLDTTRHQRRWNYLGSVAHWIYPTVLRSNLAAWERIVWWLSLIALIGATTGAVLGTLRIGLAGGRLVSPYRGWHAWHHGLGLACMLFILTWTFSGWLSMDDGLLFSTGRPTDREAKTIAGAPAWDAVPADEIKRVSMQAKEVEWFAFGRRIYRRERDSLERQRLYGVAPPTDPPAPDRTHLEPDEIDAVMNRLAPGCKTAHAVNADDDYRALTAPSGGPLYRSVCGNVWFDIDGSNGAVLEKLDPSRRAYRWAFRALHTLDFPILNARPSLRSALIVVLCGCGLAFSLTAVVIGWRRLRQPFTPVGG